MIRQAQLLLNRIKSIGFALNGVWILLRTQQNAWIHAIAATLAVALGVALGISWSEWLWVILAIMIVWITEALNTALEFLADVVSPEFDPLVKQAKDVAAGAVLIAATGAALIGLIIFLPHLIILIGQVQ